ncbi:unnamed protein product [Angiostrongylus costaricensis]|uniref:Uncharacterized protein n=1 Tax=Angiostrongylus costaricensis TaxID=334426 RepID=A0A0R3PZ99_ANGCS|nr:unnamed protein product [Angiostrongylus costaricensis]
MDIGSIADAVWLDCRVPTSRSQNPFVYADEKNNNEGKINDQRLVDNVLGDQMRRCGSEDVSSSWTSVQLSSTLIVPPVATTTRHLPHLLIDFSIDQHGRNGAPLSNGARGRRPNDKAAALSEHTLLAEGARTSSIQSGILSRKCHC